jgi:Fe-S-cluster-containing hydrogenase component 2
MIKEGMDLKEVKYLSQIDETRCIGCRRCELVCPPAAITVIENIARVDKEKCLACTKCWHLCPEDAISIVPRAEELFVCVDFEEVDQTTIEDLCRKAHVFPEQFVCACTLTLAKEVAAAILKGAKTPEEVTSMTGVRAGCSIYCMAPIIRMLKAHGITIQPPSDHRWYDLFLSLWDVPDEVADKYPGYYLKEDKKEFP